MRKLVATGEILDPKAKNPPAPLRLAFRPLFLLGSLFSIVSLSLWAGFLTGQVELAVYGGALWWHIHEMLFGFVCAIIVGFLLTAVRTWTGQPGVAGTPLAALLFLWVGGRLVLLFPYALPSWAPAAVDIAFLPVSAVILVRPIIRVKQWRNCVFIPILAAMTAANMAMHWAAHTGNHGIQTQSANAMVMLVTVLMALMAGRVLPMFTANGTGTDRVPTISWIENTAVATLLLAATASFSWPGVPTAVVSMSFFVAAAAHAIRAYRWRTWITLRTPLVWSLHLSYWCIPLGLLLYGLSSTTATVTHSQAIHTLTVGAMGMMILAMISRVSLGHTGRPIRVGAVMTSAFILLFCGFVARVFGNLFIDDYTHQIVAAAVLWSAAYGCFVALYLPILTRPRIDGRPG